MADRHHEFKFNSGSTQDSPPSVAAGLFVMAFAAVFVAVGYQAFKSESELFGGGVSERKDYRLIRRIVGVAFLSGGTVMMGAGLLLLADGALGIA
ncbi:hypothetical protein ACGFX4_00435 [Kitasatospora sp. NPDC048365]|uniref:hypothetical protein n=1 Tax=Kitasatospora sp. NPDC048365 TaxID=3364050 RepID=UPI00370FC54F